MLKVATPTQLPTLGVLKAHGPQELRLLAEDGEIRIPNVSAFYRSPYNGRIKCKRISNHPRIITYDNRELSVISCDSIDLKSDKASSGSSEGSDTNSDISCASSSRLRGILTKKSENKRTEKKSGKRVKFHEQLENVRELRDTTSKPIKCKPHPLSNSTKENAFNKLSYRATSSDSDLFRKRKQNYDFGDRKSLSCSDFDQIENISPSSFVSTFDSSVSEGAKHGRTLFKSPLRHSYNRNDRCSHPKVDLKFYQGDVKFNGTALNQRPDSMLSLYSQEIVQDSLGEKFVVCRFAVPTHGDIGLPCPQPQSDNIMRLKHGHHSGLPHKLASMAMSSTSFCNRDKASRIMRWLDTVDDIHSNEGRYAEFLNTVFHSGRNG